MSKQTRRSKYHAALSDPQLNAWVARFVQQNPTLVARWLATPHAQEVLAGRTLGQLYHEGTLGEYYADYVLQAADDPASVGAKSREQVLAAFGAKPEWHKEMSDLRAEHEATRANDDLAEEVAARLGKANDKRPHDEREKERLNERIHDEYGVNPGNPDERTRRDDVMAALETLAAPDTGPRLLRKYEEAKAILREAPLNPRQRTWVEGIVTRIEVHLDREAVRRALRSGQIDIATAQQYERSIDVRALVNGDMKPTHRPQNEWSAALAEQLEQERAAATQNELPPPKEFYIPENDGVTPRGLPPAVREFVRRHMPQPGVRTANVTVEEVQAFTGKGRPSRDAARLAYSEHRDALDAIAAMEETAIERDEREERFANGEATSRDAAARAYDKAFGMDRASLRLESDLDLAHEEESGAREALRATFRDTSPAPAPEPTSAPTHSEPGTSRAAAEKAFDYVASNQ